MKNRWILCIDEHQDVCLLIASVLSRLGFVVLTAQSYDDALSLVETVKFALYVINCEMSDGHARDIHNQIRDLNIKAPILFTTSANTPEGLLSVVSASGNLFLRLPFNVPELEGTVMHLLR